MVHNTLLSNTRFLAYVAIVLEITRQINGDILRYLVFGKVFYSVSLRFESCETIISWALIDPSNRLWPRVNISLVVIKREGGFEYLSASFNRTVILSYFLLNMRYRAYVDYSNMLLE